MEIHYRQSPYTTLFRSGIQATVKHFEMTAVTKVTLPHAHTHTHVRTHGLLEHIGSPSERLHRSVTLQISLHLMALM